MRARLLIVALVALAVVTAALATIMVGHPEDPPAQVAEGRALIGGPFTLTDHAGRRVTEGDFRGRFMLMQFGYTSCPDMCPLGLQVMAQALDELPPAVAEHVVPVFVTVDPARDTVETLRDYVGLFHPRLVGLTGSEAEIAAVIRAWRVYARKADPAASEGYLVDHSTFTYLMGPDGAYVTHFGHGTAPEAMAARIREIVAATS
jgi:cytochrome oxidase Cu insertion factor (SCO1/SenC/PrrC family)